MSWGGIGLFLSPAVWPGRENRGGKGLVVAGKIGRDVDRLWEGQGSFSLDTLLFLFSEPEFWGNWGVDRTFQRTEPAEAAALLSWALGLPSSCACEEMETGSCWGFSEDQPVAVMYAF